MCNNIYLYRTIFQACIVIEWHCRKVTHNTNILIFPPFLLNFQICFKVFFKDASAGEIGTMSASMNRTAKTNAKKGPDKDYNAFQEFTIRETEAHVLARWLNFTGMDSLTSGMKKQTMNRKSWT